MTFLETYVARKALDEGLAAAGRILEKVKSHLAKTPDEVEEALAGHIRDVAAWSSEVQFADSKSAKQTQKIYVNLDCYVVPRYRLFPQEKPSQIKLDALFAGETKHFVFLGTPGAGKTTSMKNLCNRVLMDETFYPDRFNYPVVMKLRSLNDSKAAAKHGVLADLANALGLRIQFAETLLSQSRTAIELQNQTLTDLVCTFLDCTKALLILDGLDEVADAAIRFSVVEQIRSLSTKLGSATMVVTSRTGTLPLAIDGARVFEICPLNKDQIEEFSRRWLGDEEAAARFATEIARSPFADNAIKPLTLAHLCALFERVGSIPDKPKTVYRKILHLLLEDWDDQRSVKRASQYSSFEADRKYDFLAQLAYSLTVDLGSVTFNTRDITSIYRRICPDFGLPPEDAVNVAKEIESHTGLFVQSGFQRYEFAHRSLQEFLSAEFLVRLPAIPKNPQVLLALPNELAIATSISSKPSLYFSELVLNRFADLPLTSQFYVVFVTRILQERPDFNCEPGVILSLLALYSLTLEGSSLQPHGQLDLFLYDSLITEFEKLLGIMIERDAEFRLDEHYAIKGATNVSSEIPVFRFERIKRAPSRTDFRWPRYLLVRETFLGSLRKVA